ncbi:hypothetical protein [Prevotella sp. 10(H)]|uniref:hypothetical protein n=1 Tax=Prevotella sp. 10(H) TaxID=1158294 RepID=UPI0004A7368A|nr:hypothetical protein [Prevotella sp. 10(H)]
MKSEKTIKAWLFTPFKFIAGTKSLLIGVFVLALLSVLGHLSDTHFDGALDIHYGCPDFPSPYINHALYQLIGWGTLTIVLYVTGRIVTKSSVRIIDVAGTVAMARIPLIFAALLGFIPSFHLCFGDIDVVNLTEITAVLMENILMIIGIALLIVVIAVWNIVLMYNAYSVSTNAKGVVGGLTFALGLLIAEIISKVLLFIIL